MGLRDSFPAGPAASCRGANMTHLTTRTDDERVGLDTNTLESLSIAVLKIDRLERETRIPKSRPVCVSNMAFMARMQVPKKTIPNAFAL
jgi:hypothetical protein